MCCSRFPLQIGKVWANFSAMIPVGTTIKFSPPGRDLRRSLAQPPAKSRANTKFRPGCLGLLPVGSWKPPRTETAKPPWTTAAVLSYPCSDFFNFYFGLFLYDHFVSCPLAEREAKSLSPSSCWPPCRYWQASQPFLTGHVHRLPAHLVSHG